jgi:hypothetical protein
LAEADLERPAAAARVVAAEGGEERGAVVEAAADALHPEPARPSRGAGEELLGVPEEALGGLGQRSGREAAGLEQLGRRAGGAAVAAGAPSGARAAVEAELAVVGVDALCEAEGGQAGSPRPAQHARTGAREQVCGALSYCRPLAPCFSSPLKEKENAEEQHAEPGNGRHHHCNEHYGWRPIRSANFSFLGFWIVTIITWVARMFMADSHSEIVNQETRNTRIRVMERI